MKVELFGCCVEQGVSIVKYNFGIVAVSAFIATFEALWLIFFYKNICMFIINIQKICFSYYFTLIYNENVISNHPHENWKAHNVQIM